MARRILRANESEQSVRQRAMNSAFKNFADYGAKAMATQRQSALDEQRRKEAEARAKREKAKAKREEARAKRDELEFGYKLDKYDDDLDQRDKDNIWRGEKHGWEKEKYKSEAGARKVKAEFEEKKFGFLEKKFGSEMARRIIEDEQKDRQFGQKTKEWEARQKRLVGEDRRKEGNYVRAGEKHDSDMDERGYQSTRRGVTDKQKDQRFGEASQDRYTENRYKALERKEKERKTFRNEGIQDAEIGEKGIDRDRKRGQEDIKGKRDSILFDNALTDRLKDAGFELVDRTEKTRVTDRNEGIADEKVDREIFNTQFDQGQTLTKNNRQFSREENTERRAKENQGFKREGERRKAFEDNRADSTYAEDRINFLEDKNLTRDSKRANLEKELYNEDQRDLDYGKTREAEKKRFNHAFDMEKLKAREKAKLKAKTGNKIGKLSKGEEASDRAFAKDYNDWGIRGRGSFDKNMARLKASLAKLQDEPPASLSGRFAGRMPDIMRSQESLVIEQDVRASAMGALRATLGSQFTEKEGERIMNASYDPTLEPEENVKKILLAIKELETNALNMASRSGYFEANGTLKGFKSDSKPRFKGRKRRKFTREKDSSIPFMDDAQANDNEIKMQKLNRLQELEQKARSGQASGSY